MNRIRILDLLTRKNVWNSYKVLNETQWYSKDQMVDYQVIKLKKLLMHCHQNVPYYRKIIDDNEIDIIHFESLEILNEFPILTKEIIKNNYQDFIPKNNNILKGVKESLTGGTTGSTLLKRNDAATRSVIWGSFFRFEKWMGINKLDKKLILKGTGNVVDKSLKSKISSFIVSKINNSVTVDVYDTSKNNFDKIIKLLQNNKFKFIRSYPNFLFNLAKYIDQKGLRFDVKAISTTAEPLMQEHRELFKKVFNAEIFDQYGCGEIGAIAYECKEHRGLHITEERVIVEVNEKNEAIITDLDNFTMPFIRYWNADEIVIENEGTCPCGRQSKIIKEIKGRTCDYILGLNNTYLPWAFFWILICESGIFKKVNLNKFQVVQETKEKITIYLVSDVLSNEDENYIKERIKNKLGDISIEIEYKDHIENSSSGKYRPVINNII